MSPTREMRSPVHMMGSVTKSNPASIPVNAAAERIRASPKRIRAIGLLFFMGYSFAFIFIKLDDFIVICLVDFVNMVLQILKKIFQNRMYESAVDLNW